LKSVFVSEKMRSEYWRVWDFVVVVI